MDAHDEETLWNRGGNDVEAQQVPHKMVEERVKKKSERQQQAASKRWLPNFVVEVNMIRRPGSMSKLVSTWIGPCKL